MRYRADLMFDHLIPWKSYCGIDGIAVGDAAAVMAAAITIWAKDQFLFRESD